MNDHHPSHESPTETLARSLFGFAFLALLVAIIAWIALLFAPASPISDNEQIRFVVIVGFGAILLALLTLCVWLFRTDPVTLHPIAQRMVTLIQSNLVTLIFLFLLLEINLIASTLLPNIAPSITTPFRGLLIAWSLIALGMVATIKRYDFATWLGRTRHVWTLIGFGLALIVLIWGFATATNTFIQNTGLADRLRGGLDYRVLTFYDDGSPLPSAAAFWSEQAQTRIRWSPYTYWVVEAFAGDFINVDAQGIRHTSNYTDDTTAKHVGIFGGSTVWGEGARDAYTIPSHLARLLHESGQAQQVINYGQTGYNSTQDMLMFQWQLLRNQAPEVAIFYQGFNDVLAAYAQGQVGVTLQEDMRNRDSEAGRLLRTGSSVLRLPDAPTYDFSLAAITQASPEAIVERWLANAHMIQTLANGYDVHVIFVWQPAIIYKTQLTESEQALYNRTQAERHGLFELIANVDRVLADQLAQDDTLEVMVLSDLFANDTRPIFHDLVHITEVGNFEVAQTLLPVVQAALNP